jgi:phosphoribosylformimino-5-aminoimidazole carboxamide ribotide isomerase
VIVVPAIDLRQGRCVRLIQGRADAETVFSDDPVATARRWVADGAQRLHLVDLDGAFAGAPRQAPLVAEIVRAVAPVDVEVGGGLRTLAAIETVLAGGARFAVVGTRAALDQRFLKEACAAHGPQLIVAVDARGDRVAVKGWTETTDETVRDVGRRAADAGAAALLYTDIARDGTALGPNVEATAALAGSLPIPVLASGGVGSVGDLLRLAAVPGVAGTIVGRALYTGAIDLRAALRAVASGAGRTVSGDRSSGGGSRGGAALAPPDVE